MIFGRIDEVDGHFVATRFAAGLVPTGCVYIAQSGSRSKLPGSGEGIAIPKDTRSIVIGYGRVWVPVLALGLPVLLLALGAGVPAPTWIATVLLLGVAGLAWRAGRLSGEELAHLRLLGTVTGLKIDPSRLSAQMRDAKRDSLGDLMDKGGIPMTADGILEVLDDIPAPAMPLVYGYCRYAGDDGSWQTCAAHVYHRHLENESI